jgi:N-acetylglucosamine kinase-like BadF-type ATPase
MSSSNHITGPLFLGIEGGGSHTVAILADAKQNLIKRFEAGPANVRLLNDAQLFELFKSIATALPQPAAVSVGMAGARAESDWARIRSTAERAWPEIPCHATFSAIKAAVMKSACAV